MPWISSRGLVCSTGYSAAAACAAMRAGVARLQQLPYNGDDGLPLIGAMVPDLPETISFRDRLMALLCRAIMDCAVGQPEHHPERTPLFLAVSEEENTAGPPLDLPAVLDAIEGRLGWRFDRPRSRLIGAGSAGGFEAVRLATALLDARAVEGCLVCGVDSYLSARALLSLSDRGRLKTENNPDGVFPAEAAASVWLTRAARGREATEILGVGVAQETATVLNDEPFQALGMTTAVRSALHGARLTFAEVDIRLSDLGGEGYDFQEQALVLARLLRSRKAQLPLWHPAEYIGSTGAAAGIVLLVVAEEAYGNRAFPGPVALCTASTASGGRAAVVLRHEMVTADEAPAKVQWAL
jgi:3-oxoacyl-[acyl-carrier-protein] synthase-1